MGVAFRKRFLAADLAFDLLLLLAVDLLATSLVSDEEEEDESVRSDEWCLPLFILFCR